MSVGAENAELRLSIEDRISWRGAGTRNIPWAYLSLAFLVLLMATQLMLGVIKQLPRLDEAGYGDSYVAYDVRHFVNSGVIYRPPTEAPYNPVLYSPMLYVALALPERWSPAENPFAGPRLLVITAFGLCIVLCGSLAGKLVRHQAPVLWACILVISIQAFDGWICQLRSDFFGIAFSLLAIRLLMNRSRLMPAAAGAVASAAFLFKATFVAALVAGAVWLLWKKGFRFALEFGLSAALVGLGGYGLFIWHEPYMLHNMLALKSVVIDNRGAVDLLFVALSQPALLLGVGLALYKGRRLGRNWQLVFMFAGVSFAIALVSSRQAGANVNYYFETLFALAPASAIAMLELRRREAIRGLASAVVAAMVVGLLIIPSVRSLPIAVQRLNGAALRQRNAKVAALSAAVADMRVFSTVGRYSLASKAAPPVTESFLLRYLEKTGWMNLNPLAARLQAKEFALVITYVKTPMYRGVEHLSPTLSGPIESAYQPFCRVDESLIQIPRGLAPSGTALQRIVNAGCVPLSSVAP